MPIYTLKGVNGVLRNVGLHEKNIIRHSKNLDADRLDSHVASSRQSNQNDRPIAHPAAGDGDPEEHRGDVGVIVTHGGAVTNRGRPRCSHGRRRSACGPEDYGDVPGISSHSDLRIPISASATKLTRGTETA